MSCPWSAQFGRRIRGCGVLQSSILWLWTGRNGWRLGGGAGGGHLDLDEGPRAISEKVSISEKVL